MNSIVKSASRIFAARKLGVAKTTLLVGAAFYMYKGTPLNSFSRFTQLEPSACLEPSQQGIDPSSLPYVGCSIRSMNDKPGMEIVLVNSDSPAWHAGVKLGDILIEIDGKEVNNINDYRRALSLAKENPTAEFKINRTGVIKVLEVKLG